MTHPIHDISNIPDLLLEQYRLGELLPAEMERMRLQVNENEALRARLHTLQESDEEISRLLPSGRLAALVLERLRENVGGIPHSVNRGRFHWQFRIATAVALVIMICVGWQILGIHLPQLAWMRSESAQPSDRIKGNKLVLFRKTSEGSEVLGDGASARAGDLIRIGYRAADRPFGLIISVDGRGTVTRHLPQQGAKAAPLTPEGQVLLDFAYELDDAPGWERFYFVTGQEAFDVAPILEAARNLGDGAKQPLTGKLALPDTFEQSSLILVKESTR